MRNQSVSILSELVEVCRNGEHGFREAASVVKDGHLASIFLELSEQREQFAAQLRYEISKRGSKPRNRGSLAGSLHRRWMDLRSVVASDNEHAVIAECARGEERALRVYRSALKQPAAAELHALLGPQEAQIRAAHERLQRLETRLRHQPVF
jgi:uncharacterized protein (TIGR02284 family)